MKDYPVEQYLRDIRVCMNFLRIVTIVCATENLILNQILLHEYDSFQFQVNQILEGTNQVMQILISRGLLIEK